RLTRAREEPAQERAVATLARTGSEPAAPAVGVAPETMRGALPGPRFSVVIAAYDAEATVGAAIESVLKQTETDLELIVVDDGSTDGTAAIAGAYEERDKRVLAHSQPNGGPSAARNRGIRLSRGQAVSFLDSDDLLMPRYLEEMGRALEEDPGAGLAYTDAWSLDDRSRRIHKASAMSTAIRPGDQSAAPGRLLADLVRSNFILASATVRREALEAAGGYDESLGFAEDYDLWLKIVRAGYGVVRVGGLLVVQRERGDSLSKDEAAMLGGIATVLARVADDPAAPAEAREIARGRIAKLDARIAGIEGRARLAGARIRARHMAGALRRRVGGGPATHRTPPPEVAAAFPELFES
ncbi:MAG TPA: glycosyltransferase, partial [Solirubrobacterales bacterium]|nr:glycosyltransferase [Solirubrobacterales bacterium]